MTNKKTNTANTAKTRTAETAYSATVTPTGSKSTTRRTDGGNGGRTAETNTASKTPKITNTKNTEKEIEEMKRKKNERRGLKENIARTEKEITKLVDLLQEYTEAEDKTQIKKCRDKISKLSEKLEDYMLRLVALDGVPEPFKFGETIAANRRLTATALQTAEFKIRQKAKHYAKKDKDGKRYDEIQEKRADGSAVAVLRKQDGYDPLSYYLDNIISIIKKCFYRIKLDTDIISLDSGLKEIAYEYIFGVRCVLVKHLGEKYTKEIRDECYKDIDKMLYRETEKAIHESEKANEEFNKDYTDRRLKLRYSNIYQPRVDLSEKMTKLIKRILGENNFSKEDVEIVLRSLDGDDQEFIANDIGVTQSCISKRYSKAIKVLKEYTQEIWNTVSDKRTYPDYREKMAKIRK